MLNSMNVRSYTDLLAIAKYGLSAKDFRPWRIACKYAALKELRKRCPDRAGVIEEING